MDLRWLGAAEHEVAEAMARVRRTARPSWVPTKRQVLVHVNHCLMLWYLCIVLMTLGIRIDTLQQNRIDAVDIRDMAICTAVFVAWLYGAFWLYRWAALPPSRRSRMSEWRQTLTALANGFEVEPTQRTAFVSMITAGVGQPSFYPRFAAPGVEFGNLKYRSRRSGSWHYLAVQLPVLLPHLLFATTATGGLFDELPVALKRDQRLSLEGDFDRWFHLYTPATYERDALFVVTPDVMAELIDNAHQFNIEIVDDHLVFFAPSPADFTAAESWRTVESLLQAAIPVIANASRYRDERVPQQQRSAAIASIRASTKTPGATWVEPVPRIDPTGHRLDMRDRRTGAWSVLGAIGWFATLVFLYAVPGIFAFAGFMSIVDGR
ncbi:hypothetical protein [Microbacterium sp. A93]|uniref:hypothetical protein n=1 Tax=unclassified Microbacterium TaxID=2609290 RepID=UPI003F434B8A